MDNKQAAMLNDRVSAILCNGSVAEWFSGDWDDVKCEAAIITKRDIRRPDRVMIKGDRAVVVDYKFGNKKHHAYNRQMTEYMNLLKSMGRFSHIEGYVWYISLGEIDKIE
ncbi:MAG: Dna2/Cas4 domain-containing protein [Alistipes sp.]|nr:Dna2/Cas4 domain-containing protein [Alistipes sp.]